MYRFIHAYIYIWMNTSCRHLDSISCFGHMFEPVLLLLWPFLRNVHKWWYRMRMQSVKSLYSATRFSFSTLGLSLEQALPAQRPATWGEVALQQQLSRQQEQLEALQKQHLQHQRFGKIFLSKFFTFWIFGDAAIADQGHWGHWGMTVSILRSLQAKCAFQACPGLSGGARIEVKTRQVDAGAVMISELYCTYCSTL